MSTTIAAVHDEGQMMESVLIKGDLGKLNPKERADYYDAVCRSLGLNPLTQPFSYIVLNGKLTLYANRGCTDQLRTIHKVSVEDLSESERDGVFIVTAKVKNGEGRMDMAKGAVTIASLKGDALANALMKAETKAKRRATLSLCGLGFLDETEIETIPAAVKKPPAPAPLSIVQPPPHDPETGEVVEDDGLEIPASLRRPYAIVVPKMTDNDGNEVNNWIKFGQAYIDAAKVARSDSEADAWVQANRSALETMIQEASKVYQRMMKAARANVVTLEEDAVT